MFTVHSTYVSSSYRSNRLDLSHWDPYAVRRGGCLELYYCNMVEWFWWDSSLILSSNALPTHSLTEPHHWLVLTDFLEFCAVFTNTELTSEFHVK